MLAERLSKAWRARQESVPIDSAMTFAPEGLVLGARTVLAPAETNGERRTIRREGSEARLATLLAAAHLRPVAPEALNHIRRAAERWNDGDAGLAQVHLALSRLGPLDAPGAQRLFLADELLKAGTSPDVILRALGPASSTPDTLAKAYNRDQPRVPAGNGRPSGQWTSDGGTGGATGVGSDDPSGGPVAQAESESGAHLVPVEYNARDTAGLGRTRTAPVPDLFETPPKFVAPIGARPWFMNLTVAQLGELALFIARFGGPIAALGTVFIPINKSLRQKGTVPGWPPLHYIWHSDQRALVFSYLGPNLRPVTTTAELGEDGLFRDMDGKIIGRAVPGAGVIIDRSALLPQEARGENEPTLCPKPVPDKDHGNLNGLLYESYMKALINPENPTPSKFGIGLLNPATGKQVMLDDCQRRSDILFDYKGPNYTKLLNSGIRFFILIKLISQATRQINASGGRHIVWIFEEEDTMDDMQGVFDKLPWIKGQIQLDYEPMPGFSI